MISTLNKGGVSMKKILLVIFVSMGVHLFGASYFVVPRKNPYCCDFTVPVVVNDGRPSAKQILKNIGYDAGLTCKYLFSWENLGVLAVGAPLYAVARHYDERLHSHFYDPYNHLNIHQPPHITRAMSKTCLAVPIVITAGYAFFAQHHPHARVVSQAFLIGMPLSLITKDILKHIKMDASLRPRNEYFAQYKRVYGGFPSGTMTEMAYITTLLGAEYGMKAGIPLVLASALVFGNSAAINRHYVSQLVAGTTLGVMFGIASKKLLDHRWCSQCTFDMDGSFLRCNYRF